MSRHVYGPKPDQKRLPPGDWWTFLPPPKRRGGGPYDPPPMISDDPAPIVPQSTSATAGPDEPRFSPGTSDRVPDLKRMTPTLEDLMRPPQNDRWWQNLDGLKMFPQPATPGNPFGPVPTIPAPIQGDPPSRQPESMFEPPYIIRTPAPRPPATGSVFDAGGSPGGLLGAMLRSGTLDSSDRQHPPARGLVGLLQEILRSDRARGR